MKSVKTFLRKIVGDFRDAIIFGTFVGVIVFYCISIISIMLGEAEFTFATVALLLVNIISIVVLMLLYVARRPHKYDPEIIGDNFIGIGKKNRIFNRAVEDQLKLRTNDALNGFKLLESEYIGQLSDSEKAVLYFYIARCYDIMDFRPNAAGYYEMAVEYKLPHKILPLFYARCRGSMGDIDESIALYMKILEDKENDYRMFVRTDIGRMFLRRNDGKSALKWFEEAMEKRENYAEALGGAAVAHTILHNFKKGEELYREAMLNEISDAVGFADYYKKVQAAALLETHTQEAIDAFAKEEEAACEEMEKEVK